VLTLYVEPQTGAIVKGDSVQLQTLRGPDGTDQVTILDAVIGTTPEQASAGIKYAKTQSALLALLNNTVPLVAFVLGAILLILGVILVLTSKRRSGGSHAGGYTAA